MIQIRHRTRRGTKNCYEGKLDYDLLADNRNGSKGCDGLVSDPRNDWVNGGKGRDSFVSEKGAA
jgi:hypothetical protein